MAAGTARISGVTDAPSGSGVEAGEATGLGAGVTGRARSFDGAWAIDVPEMDAAEVARAVRGAVELAAEAASDVLLSVVRRAARGAKASSAAAVGW